MPYRYLRGIYMHTPAVSVIVPVYNGAGTIEKCISSLLASTGVTLQIIIADDGSTDKTGEICRRLASSHPQITYLPLSHKGVSAARNAALAAASCEYTGFCDSDDYVEPDMFASMSDAMVSGDSIVSVCGFYRDHAESSEKFCHKDSTRVSFRDFRKNLLTDESTEGFLFNKLFRTDLLRGHFFDESLSYCEDLAFIFGLEAPEGAAVSYCPRPLYHYVQQPDSLTGSRSFFKNGVFRYAPAFAILRKAADTPALKKAVDRKYYSVLRYSLIVELRAGKADNTENPANSDEIGLIRQEMRRNFIPFTLSSASFRKWLSYLKTAFAPVSALVRSFNAGSGR